MRTQFLKVTSESIQKAAMVVQNGGIVVYPTDTVYGLGCDPFDERAVQRLTTVKARSKGNLPVLVDSLRRAKELGEIDIDVRPLTLRFWPGPLTIVVPSRVSLPLQVSGPENMIGLRIPGRQDTLNLISKSGGSLVGTSANISGVPSISMGEDAFKVFEGKVDIVLDGGFTSTSPSSTVVTKTLSGIRVLREGAISRTELGAVLTPNVQLQE